MIRSPYQRRNVKLSVPQRNVFSIDFVFDLVFIIILTIIFSNALQAAPTIFQVQL